MSFEDFFETEDEDSGLEKEPEEKKLSPEEVEQLECDMNEYTEGLKARIDEIKKRLNDVLEEDKRNNLETELEDLEEQYIGLVDFIDDIDSNNFDEILIYDKQERKDTQEKETITQILGLVEKINESGETLSFPGIREDVYLKMKETELDGYVTPIDEVIERCKREGIKIVTGNHPESGNIYVLPASSDDIEMDSITPHQLNIGNVENKHLVDLIQLTTKRK